jgi:hypothetical protein
MHIIVAFALFTVKEKSNLLKKVFASLWTFQKQHFEMRLYSGIALLLLVLLVFNYTLDFEDSYIDKIEKLSLRWMAYFFYEGIPFLCAGLILYRFGKCERFIKRRGFWVVWALGFAILAFDRSLHIREYVQAWVPGPAYRIWFRSIGWSSSLLITVVPLMIIYEVMDRSGQHKWYGLAPGKFDVKPYLYLLLIAGVFIGIGSFFNDIQTYYPRYRISEGQQFARYYELSEWVPLTMFELSYASNFVTVELFFRGFLIYAFTRYFGNYAVLPMIVAYCVLHFGKPLTESLSSIVGGYALGILALQNRNIWGGVIIHIGVAWLMEVFGFLQRWVQYS